MILLYNDKEYATYGGVMEDVDPSKNRIFINRMGMDLSTLAIRFSEFFKGQSVIDQYNTTTTGDTFYNEIPIQTAGKWAWGFVQATGRASAVSPPGHMDPWFASLDYENFPGRRSFMTYKGLIVFQMYSGYTTTDGTADYWVGSDMTGPADYYIQGNSNYVTVFEEDLYNDSFYGINYDNGTYYLGKLIVTAAAVTWVTLRSTTTGHYFYLGKNTKDNSFMFVEHNGASGQLTFYACSGNSAVAPVALYTSWSPNPNTTHYQYPSNVWHKSNTQKIFYQALFDNNLAQEFKEVIFTKYEWNPTSASITQSVCNMVYPAGTSYIDYHRMAFYTSANHNNMTNNWFYKPHYFSFNGVNYITLIYIDKGGATTWSERVHYDQYKYQSRWITYSISDDGNTLTYHSIIDFPNRREMPTYYMPYNAAGTQLLVTTSHTLYSLNFSATNGWYISDSEPVSVRSMGIDSTGRVYIGTRFSYYDTANTQQDGRGYYSMYQYIPPNPVVVEVTPASAELLYENTNINTSVTVNALNSSGTRVVANVRLVITNSCMTFTDGTTSKTITTSSSADTTVSVIVTGAGKPVIVASIVSS